MDISDNNNLKRFKEKLLSLSLSRSDSENESGFTLIELLVVIAILATLAVAVTLIINPAELVRQARDSTRLSDINQLNKALGVYRTDQYDESMGNSNTVYISLPDSNSDCSSHSLPSLPSGWSYNCVTEDNLTNVDGTGWVPVDFTSMSFQSPLSTLPTDPINSDNSNLYYEYYVGSYQLTANMESTRYLSEEENDGGSLSSKYEAGSNLKLAVAASAGDWITVPGSSTYGTNDFEVMKYEAKCVSDEGNPLTSPSNSSNTYDDNATACNSSNDRYVAAVAGGYPITEVDHGEAKSYCQQAGGHLITNDEWMTIARNAAQVDSNWTGGSVGSGCLFRGNSGDSTCGYNGPNPDSGDSRNNRASFTLSNGETIYDIAGNVWEHVKIDSSDTLIPQNNQPTLSTAADDGAGTRGWGEFTDISGYGQLSYDDVRPSDSSWSSSQGMGQIYTYGDDETSTTNRVFLRGATWRAGSGAGAFTLFLGWNTGSQNRRVGFRCAR